MKCVVSHGQCEMIIIVFFKIRSVSENAHNFAASCAPPALRASPSAEMGPFSHSHPHIQLAEENGLGCSHIPHVQDVGLDDEDDAEDEDDSTWRGGG